MKSLKNIDHVNQLPDWYDLDKYHKVNELNSIEWYEQLIQRHTHAMFAKYYPGHESETTQIFYSSLQELRRNPILSLEEPELISLIGGQEFDLMKHAPNDFVQNYYAVSPLTLNHVYQHESHLNPETRKRIRKHVDTYYDVKKHKNISKEDHIWAGNILRQPIFDVLENEHIRNQRERSYDLAVIDLSLPDKVLEQQFSDYLRTKRKRCAKFSGPIASKLPEFDKWIEFSILPYIDLQIWARENNFHIPDRVMADAIFSDGTKGEETVRKTTRNKYVKKILNRDYLNYLETVIAHELAERK